MSVCRTRARLLKRPDDHRGTCSSGDRCGRARRSKEQITPVEGLSALSLDALTSVAYGPEAIIIVLALAGAGALHLVLPITVAIVVLLAILVFSYRQVIEAYPGGGGAYAVSRANLGHQRQPGGRGGADRRLHTHGGGVHRCRSGGTDLGVS